VNLSEKVTKAERVLRQEIDILKEINHPGIIRMLNSFETKERLYCVLELWYGGTLQDLIMAKGHSPRHIPEEYKTWLTDEQASTVMKSIFTSVSYLHSKGIVHRDLKPENIIFNNQDDLTDIKLIDFGLTAKYNDAWPMSLLDAHWGTALYMAPEIAMRQEYSKSIDVWSLGIIMYNLISGGQHPLFKNGESLESFKKKLEKQKQFYYTDAFSELARDLINKMTSYSPVHRYNIDQALKHPWITRSHETKVPLTCIEMFKILDIEDKLKKVYYWKINDIGNSCSPFCSSG